MERAEYFSFCRRSEMAKKDRFPYLGRALEEAFVSLFYLPRPFRRNEKGAEPRSAPKGLG
jgi:hypothetical protein